MKKATAQIANLRPGESKHLVKYEKKDEVGLLVESINGLNTRLSIQEKIRSRLMADISHELKTPITSIQCYLEGISDGVIQLSEKNLDSITSEMGRLTQLVNQIMEFEKFESSEIQLQKKAYNPYTLISDLVETQRTQLSETDQTIVMQGSQNIELYLDRDAFTQLVYNLIGNFRKYAGSGTNLEIRISGKEIIFRDNGKGIPKKEIPFLFEKFYQGKKEKSGSIESRGIGVGLSIVKKIIDAHNWKARIDSDTNTGFSFIIQL